MANTYEIIAQEIWLVERSFKCPLINAISSCENSVPVIEIEDAYRVLKTRVRNSSKIYPNGFVIDWGTYPQSEIFKIQEVQLVSTIMYTTNDNPSDASFSYKEAHEFIEPGDYDVLEERFIDIENYYQSGYEILEIRLA